MKRRWGLSSETATSTTRPPFVWNLSGLWNSASASEPGHGESDSEDADGCVAGSGSAKRNYLLVLGLATLWAFLSSCHYASGQLYNFRDFGSRRESRHQPFDSRTFLHFLTHTRESLCRREGNSLLYSQRVSHYCSDASVADQLVHSGLVSGYRMCQSMFKDERWNCTFSHQFLNTGFPQAGFVWAITVSKAIEELVMACRRGVPGLDCQCFHGNRGGGGGGGGEGENDEGESGGGKGGAGARRKTKKRRPKRSFSGGVSTDAALKPLDPEKIGEKYGKLSIPTCDDNIGHASRQVRKFFADNDKAAVAAMGFVDMVNFHNRRVGHLVVKSSQAQICHCLGISGSCTKKFCIRGLQPYSRRIEANLHGLYQKSRLVTPPPQPRDRRAGSGGGGGGGRNRGGGRAVANRLLTYDPETGRTRRVKKRTLAYTARPPHFCEKNEPAGYHGVEGRQCNNTRGADERGSCAHLCCGPYKYERTYTVQKDWCDCRMRYNPIRVECQPCEKRLEVHRCRQVRQQQLYPPMP